MGKSRRSLNMPGLLDAEPERRMGPIVGSDWEAILENLKDCVFCKDRDLRYTFVNPAMAALLNLPAEELLGKTDTDLWDAGTAARLEDIDRLALLGQQIETETSRPVNGHPHIFNSIRSPRRGNDGKAIGLCGIDRDITERRDTEQRLRALVANSPLAVIEWDSRHRIVSWAGSAPEIFGWNASEVVGKRLDEFRFVHEGDWERVRAAMDVSESGQNFACRNRNYRKDG